MKSTGLNLLYIFLFIGVVTLFAKFDKNENKINEIHAKLDRKENEINKIQAKLDKKENEINKIHKEVNSYCCNRNNFTF